ncbi:aspartyl-phosphate phosphatase Spo0E family protein [Bacillus tuaregi]|uniref:aspartyl-phosphate phosphatase Spo0E family protein n=1 Tax=Bacillus tuaregi TaxID=1816695 RepID=UPI0008F8005B|nr:aspartyl-phosphate phosphatase Spo0E family protein [Bacillus tuaregi]
MQDKKKTILAEIQKKREKMIELAHEKGLTNNDTIKCSQELDQLIYQYQSSFRKNRRQRGERKRNIKYMLLWSKIAITS